VRGGHVCRFRLGAPQARPTRSEDVESARIG